MRGPGASRAVPDHVIRDRLRAAWPWPAALAALLVLLYADVVPDLVRAWDEDPNYSHGFAVPVISAVALWQMRDRLRRLEPRPNAAGLVLLALGLAAFLLGTLGAEYFLTRASLVAVLAGLVAANLGWSALALRAFPIGFLLLMVPLPAVVYNGFAFPLQQFAALCSARVLDLLRIPVLLEGNTLHLSRMSLGVTEACSGLRSLISLIAMAAAWAHFMVAGRWRKVAIVLLAVPVAVATNVLRVLATALIARSFGLRYAEGFFHSFSGIVVFALAFAIVIAASLVGARPERRSADGEPGTAGAASGLPEAPLRARGVAPGMALASGLLLLAPLLLLRAFPANRAIPLRLPLAELPREVGGWQAAEDRPFSDRSLDLLQASDTLNRRYVDSQGHSVWLYIGYWESQRRGAIAHSPRNCLPGGGWSPIRDSRSAVALAASRVAAPGELEVNDYLVANGPARQLFLFWYMAQGRSFAGEVRARLAMVESSLRERRTDGAIVRVSASVEGSEEETRQRLGQYIRVLHPLLGRHLPD